CPTRRSSDLQRRTVGMSDVARAAAGMNALVESDDRQGGHTELERAAVKGRDGVLELQQRNAGERVRRALYALAAEYSTIAAWSCIDARNLDQAQRHLNESATDRKSTRLNSSHVKISYAVFCLKKKKNG